MCGIAGSYEPEGATDAWCEAQLHTVVHRGPDSLGVHLDGPAAVGQTRLAIIDLVTGDPPIATPDGAIGVALNGEIYNYAALREGLLCEGHELHTRGDTEVIAHLAERLEPAEMAATLDGMFAFALWDRRRSRLVLGRDRLGKKPLYWWSNERTLVFGSEIKAVMAHPAVPRRLSERALPAYLAFGYVPTPETFFDGVQSLPPGHVLVFDGVDLTMEPYWSPPTVGVAGATGLDVTFDEAVGLVREELEASVARRMVADVPVGAFLSGGVDSSAIVALMARLAGGRVHTFTIGFDDVDGFDERDAARRTAAALGTDHHEFVVHPDIEGVVERLVWHHDQPFGDSSAVAVDLLSGCTRTEVTVALSGDGGDEAFAGYERFTAAALYAGYRRLPGPIRDAARLIGRVRTSSPKHPFRKLQRFVAPESDDMFDVYVSWLAFADRRRRAALLPHFDDWGTEGHRAVWDASDGAAPANRLLDLNLRTYLLDDLLPKTDRMSMAHGLEVRSPFLDHRLIELGLRLPPATRARGLKRKRVLRAAVRDLVPAHVLEYPKRGFALPLDRWFRTDLEGWITSLIGPGARLRHHLRPAALDSLLAEHQRGAHHGQLLWALATAEVFLGREDW